MNLIGSVENIEAFFSGVSKQVKKTYVDTTNTKHTVGSVNAKVYHVKKFPEVIACLIQTKEPLYSNSPKQPCYGCGSIFARKHTPSCDFSIEGDDLDLPQQPHTQWWG